MANSRNRRRKKLKLFKHEEIIQLERKATNLLIDCISENLDDILPIEWKKKHICEHYRKPKKENFKKPKDESQILALSLKTAVVMFVLHYMGAPDWLVFIVMFSIMAQWSKEEPVFLAVAFFIVSFFVGICVENHLKMLM